MFQFARLRSFNSRTTIPEQQANVRIKQDTDFVR